MHSDTATGFRPELVDQDEPRALPSGYWILPCVVIGLLLWVAIIRAGISLLF